MTEIQKRLTFIKTDKGKELRNERMKRQKYKDARKAKYYEDKMAIYANKLKSLETTVKANEIVVMSEAEKEDDVFEQRLKKKWERNVEKNEIKATPVGRTNKDGSIEYAKCQYSGLTLYSLEHKEWLFKEEARARRDGKTLNRFGKWYTHEGWAEEANRIASENNMQNLDLDQ